MRYAPRGSSVAEKDAARKRCSLDATGTTIVTVARVAYKAKNAKYLYFLAFAGKAIPNTHKIAEMHLDILSVVRRLE